MSYFLPDRANELSNQSLVLVFDIVDQYNNFLLYCVDKCLKKELSVKYEKNIQSIQIKGTEYQKIQIPNITSDIDTLNDYFLKDLLSSLINKNGNASLLFKKYLVIGAKLIASYFYSDYPSTFDVCNYDPLISFLNKLYSNALNDKDNGGKVELKKVDVDFSREENPNNYHKFLKVDVSQIDQYNTYKYSVEKYAQRTAYIMRQNLTTVFNYFYKSKETMSEQARKEIDAAYSSIFTASKIAEVAAKAFDDFVIAINKFEKGDLKALDTYTKNNNIIHSIDLKKV